MNHTLVCSDPEIMGGTPVFRGTRVPEGFPSVTREQVIAFREEAKDRLVESVS